MEEYLNLYHQKLWEIAYENLIRTFFYPTTILLFVLFLIFWCIFFRKKWIILFISSYFFLFLFAIAAEYVNSYDKIMNPASPYNISIRLGSLKYETVLPILEHVDEIRLASVDGELKREDIILFAVSNPTYYDGLFADVANSLAGSQTIGTDFLVALVGYEEKNGEWQSVDIRIAPGVEEKDFKKFSKVLHIKKDEAEGATDIILNLQELYEKKLQKEKDGH
ncbi:MULTISPECIES: hypothetical protein [Streptococcus]|uniref:hypothetical protein n=1 Tax=Streptococcus TaxID=1301 RepID=UPI000FAD2DD0|nr:MULTISPECIES: hypothetical protein [Streptococcus]RSJ45494.1 hypothetical protein D8816_07435 [Streptococcus gordonii]RSJ47745.1 hypothetical protein D8815_04760 [Streptococcus gordonii]RSJ50770.1 hypothetical protein D8813_07775 [Streptococcus gordonii]